MYPTRHHSTARSGSTLNHFNLLLCCRNCIAYQCICRLVTVQVCLQAWTGEESLGDSLLSTFQRLPHVRWIITTLGARGSVFLEHVSAIEDSDSIPTMNLDDVLKDLSATVREHTENSTDESPACSAASGAEIRYALDPGLSGFMLCHRSVPACDA